MKHLFSSEYMLKRTQELRRNSVENFLSMKRSNLIQILLHWFVE